MSTQQKLKAQKRKEQLKVKEALNKEKKTLEDVRNTVKYFYKFFFELVDKMATAFPDIVDEYIVNEFKELFVDIKEEDYSKYVKINDFRSKSASVKYILQYFNNIKAIKEQLELRNFEIFEMGKRTDYDGPVNVLYNCEIDFYKLWDLDDMNDGTRNIIFTYLNQMVQLSEKLIGYFEVSDKNRLMVNAMKNEREVRKKMFKSKVNELVGQENETINTIVDDVFGEFEKKKQYLKPGQINHKKIMELFKTVHSNLTDKYEQGNIDEDEIQSTAESLFDNIMNNNDNDEMMKGMGDLMGMMKDTGMGDLMGGMPDMDMDKVKEFMDKKENPFRK